MSLDCFRYKEGQDFKSSKQKHKFTWVKGLLCHFRTQPYCIVKNTNAYIFILFKDSFDTAPWSGLTRGARQRASANGILRHLKWDMLAAFRPPALCAMRFSFFSYFRAFCMLLF